MQETFDNNYKLQATLPAVHNVYMN